MIAYLLAALALQDPSMAPAESLLAARDVAAALRLAQHLVARRPQDPAALILLGRVHFARPVIGRYPALEAFRTAARLAPADPEPLYWQMQVGFFLGSDEGEVIARGAILRILALNPGYADVWERFQTLYHNAEIWRRADRALARHPDDVVAMERRAEVAIALERPLAADSLLGEVLRRRGPRVAAYVLRAEANFNAGRDASGYAWYDSAVTYADIDSTGAMWDAVWMVASPTEAATHDSLAPGERREFFARFWAPRDPNLLTPENERIAEHFRRFAHARRYYRLLHPMNLYYRSSGWRTLVASEQSDFLAARGMPDPDPDLAGSTAPASALAGVDARGLIYLRHGPPDYMLRGYFDPLRPFGSPESSLDVEGWLYRTPEGPLSIGFRHSGGSAGDFIFLPTNRHQVLSTRLALETDRTALPAPLEVRAWSAYFKSAELGLTDVYYKPAGDSAAAVLWSSDGQPTRASGAGLLQLAVPPGRYALGLDVDSSGVLGRTRGDIDVPRFSLVDLGLSSLVLAASAELQDREDALRALPVDLTYPAATPLAAYIEVYGLTVDRDDHARYRVRYSFAPLRSLVGRLTSGARPVVFEFDRDVLGGTARERLIITPDELPSGRYRVTVAVTDLRRNVKSESVALDVTIR